MNDAKIFCLCLNNKDLKQSKRFKLYSSRLR